MSILAANFKPLFKELQWHQASEYTLLALLAVSLPLSWRIALWCLILLCANTLVRIFVTRHVGNPALDRPTRICLSLMMLFYLVYALSGIYSNNPHEALSTISTMLPLILFPLVFLLTDTHYLTRRHLSLLTYLMAATLTVRFIIMLIRSAFHSIDTQLFSSTTDLITALLTQLVTPAIQAMPFPELGRMIAIPPFRVAAHLFDNTMFDSRPTYLFDPLHHNYLALYILTAIALLYNELMRHWHSPRWHRLRWFVILDIGLLSAYILLSGSRSGMVAWVLLFIACLAHLAIARHRWRTICIILVTLTSIIGISYWASPSTYKRVTSTVNNLRLGEQGDLRQSLWQSGLEIAKERPLFGYGCDGYWEALFQQYRSHDHLGASITGLSTHNQYLETTLVAGLVGLSAMLAMILIPALLSLRRPHRNLPMILFTVVYAACIFFEATFGRQMGLLFIGFWYCLILLYPLSPSSHPANA